MNKMFKINGNPEQYKDLDVFHKLAQQFLPYAQQSLGFDKPVGVNLLSDPENVKDPLGKTAYYDPNKMEITLFVDKRHVKDILRSMAHELVHHTQNCRGEFDGGVETGPGYAQDDEHMRKMEAEAYLKGSGFLLRDWEDSLKENKTMSKRKLTEQVAGKEHSEYAKDWAKRKGHKLPTGPWKETEKRIPKSAGVQPTDEDVSEEEDVIEEEEDLVTKVGKAAERAGEVVKRAKAKKAAKDAADRILPPEELAKVTKDDEDDEDDDKQVAEPDTREKRENWFRGNKDELLFERLVEKWTK